MPPAALVPKAVALGGALHQQITDGYLVTSIINPSHVLSGYAKSNAALPESELRMPDYSNDLTVAEVTDLVAFLQSKYSVQRAPRYPNTL